MKWLVVLFLTQPVFAEFNPVPTGDIKTDQNLRSVVEEMKRIEASVTTTTWTNAGVVISTTPGSSGQGITFQDQTIQYTAATAFNNNIATTTLFTGPLPVQTTAYVYNVNCSTLSVLTSSATYILDVNLYQESGGTNTHYFIRFNADGGSNYDYRNSTHDNSAGITLGNSATQAQAYIDSKGAGSGTDNGQPFTRQFYFSTMPEGSGKLVYGWGCKGMTFGNTSVTSMALGCYFKYSGAAIPTSIALCADQAGKYSGWIKLYNEGPQ